MSEPSSVAIHREKTTRAETSVRFFATGDCPKCKTHYERLPLSFRGIYSRLPLVLYGAHCSFCHADMTFDVIGGRLYEVQGEPMPLRDIRLRAQIAEIERLQRERSE